ncbi:MAG: hypothetical protein IKI60_01765 [Alloprevotella sp.]|nr:hypothetical protein [Alloprevotella sp.]
MLPCRAQNEKGGGDLLSRLVEKHATIGAARHDNLHVIKRNKKALSIISD